MEKPVYKLENGIEVEITPDRELDKYYNVVDYPEKVVIYPDKLTKMDAILERYGDPTEIFNKMNEEEAAKKMQSKK